MDQKNTQPVQALETLGKKQLTEIILQLLQAADIELPREWIERRTKKILPPSTPTTPITTSNRFQALSENDDDKNPTSPESHQDQDYDENEDDEMCSEASGSAYQAGSRKRPLPTDDNLSDHLRLPPPVKRMSIINQGAKQKQNKNTLTKQQNTVTPGPSGIQTNTNKKREFPRSPSLTRRPV